MQRAFEQDGHPIVHVDASDEVHAQAARPNDVLFLKGHGWPGNAGGGVAHKSPEVWPAGCGCGKEHEDSSSMDRSRLVLTIDTATDW